MSDTTRWSQMRRVLAPLRAKLLDLTLWALFGASTVLMLKSSTDPRPEANKGNWLEPLLSPFPTGNQVVFDVTVGVIVSLFVYVLVVRIPERAKRKRLRASLRRQYETLKENCIHNFLWACDHPAHSDLVERLKDRENFKSFFKAPVSSSQDRWHAVLNGLDDYKVESLLLELEDFRREVEYTLNAVDVNDAEAFAFLKRLTQVLHRSRRWSDKNDQLKQLSQFMWSIHTGWSWVAGYTDRDAVAEKIEAV